MPRCVRRAARQGCRAPCLAGERPCLARERRAWHRNEILSRLNVVLGASRRCRAVKTFRRTACSPPEMKSAAQRQGERRPARQELVRGPVSCSRPRRWSPHARVRRANPAERGLHARLRGRHGRVQRHEDRAGVATCPRARPSRSRAACTCAREDFTRARARSSCRRENNRMQNLLRGKGGVTSSHATMKGRTRGVRSRTARVQGRTRQL